MNQGTEPAHKLLELLIMKAIISGKAKGSSIRLYAPDLVSDIEQISKSKVDLVINFDLSWDEPVDFFDEIEAAEDEHDGKQ